MTRHKTLDRVGFIAIHPADVLNDLNVIKRGLLQLKKFGCLLL